jgi:hypothetical protein
MHEMCADEMTSGEGTYEGKFTCHHSCGDETGEHLGVMTGMCRMGALEAEHLEHSLLGGKHCTTANGADLDGWHGDSDEQIFPIICSG